MFGFVVSAATNCGVILITSTYDFSKKIQVRSQLAACPRRTDLPSVRLCVGDRSEAEMLTSSTKCPLCPQERTFVSSPLMSAKCHKPTFVS